MAIKSNECWKEVKGVIQKVSDEYDMKWRKRKRVVGTQSEDDIDWKGPRVFGVDGGSFNCIRGH